MITVPSISRQRIMAALLITWIAMPSKASYGKEYLLTEPSELKATLKEVRAGDSIVLQDGVWTDAKLKFEQLPGSVEAAITIRAQTVGGVIFSGATEFRFSGQFVTVSGFVFKNSSGSSEVLETRSHSERLAHHSRVTECVFQEDADFPAGMESHWLSIYGTQNRVDHCSFTGKKSRGTTLVVWVDDHPGRHRIDHNHFGPRPELGRNGGETIRIGTSEVSEQDCETIVEENHFYRCNGESEIVSNKSCGNVYRYNVFEECAGALTLRHGHRCLVDANVFLGRQQRGTGGVRIIGQGHRVTNNYFEGLRGDAERAALCVMNGIPNAELHTYAPVRDAVVSGNTFIDCKVSLELGLGDGQEQTAKPQDCRFTNNLFVSEKWPLFRVHAVPINATWAGNRQQTGSSDEKALVKFESSAIKLQRAADGLLRPDSFTGLQTGTPGESPTDIDGHPRTRPDLVGCDDPSTHLRGQASLFAP